MKEQSVVHIKVDYEDALATKRNILSSEVNFLKTIKTIKRYKLLRGEELNNRLRVQNKIKELKLNITKINEVFPKVKLPEILRKAEIKKKNEEEKKEKQEKVKEEVKEKHQEDDLETQLREIQEKLMKLG